MSTHETFIQAVAEIALDYLGERSTKEERDLLRGIKLVYGAGDAGVRGVTYYSRWKGTGAATVPFVEVCAFAQSSHLQIAGTCIHELGHVLAGFAAGHGPQWREACKRLGLRHCRAAGTEYRLACFEPSVRQAIAALPRPQDGEPVPGLASGGAAVFKPCPAGIGTRGGKSRGKGSGSRLRLWLCECEPPVRARVASDHFRATCDDCASGFHQP